MLEQFSDNAADFGVALGVEDEGGEGRKDNRGVVGFLVGGGGRFVFVGSGSDFARAAGGGEDFAGGSNLRGIRRVGGRRDDRRGRRHDHGAGRGRGGVEGAADEGQGEE